MVQSKQTSAVELLIEEFIVELYLDCNIPPDKRDRILETVNKARQKFKEQILHAATYGCNSESPEKYYENRY